MTRLVRAALPAVVLVLAGCAGAHGPASYHLIPQPRRLEPGRGAFEMGPGTRITLSDPNDAELRRLADFWADPVRAATGFDLPVVAQDHSAGAGIRLVLEDGHGDPEGYRLTVGKDGVTIRAPAHVGIFYGLQTLTQMLPATLETPGSHLTSIRIPAVSIDDAPRFSYRGMHLDVSRHFFGPEFVKRYIDLLARYKINYFHWHLTDDQGWRIEIRRYPELTRVGAYRKETQVGRNARPYVGDGKAYGGFYTQDEVRDIVAYARERYVTIIPEIEMPGHSEAALAAYPELACTDGPFEVGTHWGVYDDVLCPKEGTFLFLENVLSEVMDLFPGPYIHVGGDEAPKIRWEHSDVAQGVMDREGMLDENELQSWFMARIGRFLNEHGRRLVGWDEILEGGLAPDATVMSWRGTSGGVEAARRGHDVIMTPTDALYFDYYQGDPEQEPLAIGGYVPLKRVYSFDPVPQELEPEEARHVLGAQGNVWTEYMATEDHVEYMVLPRMLALSELTWSADSARTFDDFLRRLPWHLARFDALGLTYRIPDVVGLEHDRITLEDRISVPLSAPVPGGRLRYVLDGSEPDSTSPVYRAPIRVDLRDGPVTVAARAVLPDGRMGPVRRARFERTSLSPAAMVDPAILTPGLRVSLYRGAFRSVSGVSGIEPSREDTVSRVGLPSWVPADSFALRFRGYLDVPEDAVYSFRLTSDDGSRLSLAGRQVLDHDGAHGPTAKEAQVALAKGPHPIEILYFQAGGAATLGLEVERKEGWEPVPVTWLRRTRQGPRRPMSGWGGPDRSDS